MRTMRLTLAALAALLILSASAHAGRSQETIFQDDPLVHDPAQRDKTLDELRALGVDTLRTQAVWADVAPSPTSKTRPSFDAADPAAYPAERWDRIDGVVRGASARGIDVLMTVTGPLPAWASDCGGAVSVRRICRPDPAEYRRFFTAVARRFAGSYRDENEGGGVLPRVDRWSAWNEPNQAGWLYPQWTRKRGRYVPDAPHRYRRLVDAAGDALRATGHARSQFLIGETAPLGRDSGSWSKRSIAPVTFYRELFCLDSRGRALTGSARSLRGCPRRYAKLDADGVAHHPYTRGGGNDPRARIDSDEATIYKIDRVTRELDRAARKRRIRFGAPIYFTEYGFQTNPPDRIAGTSLSRQSEWLNESDWLAWKESRVRGVAQYELRDEYRIGGFQTGLRFHGGDAKPAYGAYRTQIWPTKAGRYTRIWGQLRSAVEGRRQLVQIQYRLSSRSSWKTIKTTAVTGPRDFIYLRVRKRAAYWRLVWEPVSGGGTMTSRTARPASS